MLKHGTYLRALLIACSLLVSGSGVAAPGSAGISTVVLVTIDTWRRDANGFLGGLEPSPTPFLDRLASRSLVATDAVSPVPLTGPSHWSILSGRWPWREGVRLNGERIASRTGPTLAELLGQAGWVTSAFVSSAVLDHSLGFSRGFVHFDDHVADMRRRGGGRMPQRLADATVRAALAWLETRGAGEKILLWVHLFDPHFPYRPPGGPFGGDDSHYRFRYLGEVAFADRQVRALWEGLGRAGRGGDRSLWIVLADHGEGLGEHGAMTHGYLLHGAATSIPLLVSGPTVPAGRDDRLASTVDVLPTILDLLSLEGPEIDGSSLLREPPAGERSIPLETLFGQKLFGLSPAWGLRTGRWLWERSPADHLWDVGKDPDESTDLAGDSADIVRRLLAMRRGFGMPSLATVPPLDPGMEQKLQALGYLRSDCTSGPGCSQSGSPPAAEKTAAETDVRRFVAASPNSLGPANGQKAKRAD